MASIVTNVAPSQQGARKKGKKKTNKEMIAALEERVALVEATMFDLGERSEMLSNTLRGSGLRRMLTS